MRVFRRRFAVAWLALLALAMQAVLALALTHGHTHARAPAGVASGLEARAITYGACRSSAERSCPLPAQHDDDSHCPICWSVSLASGAVLYQPPAVPFLRPRLDAPAPVRGAALIDDNATVHFQARAPPLA